MVCDKCTRKLTRPVRVWRFSMLTSSPFTTGTGDAKAKSMDAISAKKKRAMRVMVVQGNVKYLQRGQDMLAGEGETLDNRTFE